MLPGGVEVAQGGVFLGDLSGDLRLQRLRPCLPGLLGLSACSACIGPDSISAIARRMATVNFMFAPFDR
jgi:hypothetical protein